MAIGNPITLTNNVSSKIVSVTATADQTSFTVTDGYRINGLAVFRNGVRLVGGVDFTATDGASVTLTTGANADDTIEFQIFDDFRVADAMSSSGDQTLDGDLTVTGTISGLTSVTGATIGIQSGGTVVGSARTFNFIGAGNTFAVNGDTIDISISSGGAAGLWANYDSETGVTTTNKVRIQSDLEVTGVTTTGTLAVSGVATAASSVVAGIITTNSTGIDAGAGIITATTFSGSGASLTNLNASQLASGTVADARLGTVSSSKLSGALPALNGSALTNLNIPTGFNELDAALFN
jgi:cytoskeletal protein CcmA (bactofilin family)|tara:strand:+ start:360 stop:1241 length:882 start_codon:yes stop_codon:yes gene_type:complete